MAKALEHKGGWRPRGDPRLEHHRHIEAWYGITGIGAIYHTLNPRLFPDQIVWIANHAEDAAVLRHHFPPLLEEIAPKLKKVKLYSSMTDRAHLPAQVPQPRRLRGFHRRGGRQVRNGGSSTRTPLAGFATPRAPRAIPRACSTPTAPT